MALFKPAKKTGHVPPAASTVGQVAMSSNPIAKRRGSSGGVVAARSSASALSSVSPQRMPAAPSPAPVKKPAPAPAPSAKTAPVFQTTEKNLLEPIDLESGEGEGDDQDQDQEAGSPYEAASPLSPSSALAAIDSTGDDEAGAQADEEGGEGEEEGEADESQIALPVKRKSKVGGASVKFERPKIVSADSDLSSRNQEFFKLVRQVRNKYIHIYIYISPSI